MYCNSVQQYRDTRLKRSLKTEVAIMERKAGACAVTMLLCSLTAAIAVWAMIGVAIAQQNNFVLSSSAFADNGTMAQKYMGKNPANPNCTGENVSPPLEWRNAPATTRSYAIIMYDPREPVTGRELVSSVAAIFFIKDHTMAAARQRGLGRTTTCLRLSQRILIRAH
jgi:F0F1-type ATP synthase membrane subunit c/vacuolar-type H+-ATPase subunit K